MGSLLPVASGASGSSSSPYPSFHDTYHPQFAELFTLARLAHKYEITAIEQQVAEVLKEFFTNDFERWDAQDFPLNASCINPIDAIRLAWRTNNPSMLPLAFYLCVQYEEGIVDGRERGDGSIATLDIDDLKRCIRLYAWLSRRCSGVIRDTLHYRLAKRCVKNQAQCWSIAENLRQDEPTFKANRLLHPWRYTVKESNLCEHCQEMFIEEDRTQRRRLWDELPRALGLENELKGHWPGY